MIHCLYKTTNRLNGKYYIGAHSTNDLNFGTETWIDPYIGSGRYIYRALQQYGRKYFNVEIIAYFDKPDHAYQAENDIVTDIWIQKHKGEMYNLTPGGNKPPKITKESAKKGAETRARIFLEMFGGRSPMADPEVRKKVSQSWSTEMKETAKQRTKNNNPMTNPYFREKVSKAKLGKPNPYITQKNLTNNPMKNKCWITNEMLEMVIIKTDIMPDGWKLGRIKHNKPKRVTK
jgi:hypothetical protein